MATALFLVVGRIETFFDHGGRKCLAAYAHQYVRAQCGVVAVYESHGEVSAQGDAVIAGGNCSNDFSGSSASRTS